jgi:hypothetical protein
MSLRRFRLPALLVLLVAFVLPTIGAAITFLSDDGGRHAPVCSFLDSAGRPAYCSSTNPLPTTSGGVQSQSDPTGYGRAWFLSSGVTVPNGQRVTGIMLDNLTAVLLGHNGANQMIVQTSRDGGRTYSVSYITGGAAFVGQANATIRLTDGSLLIAGQTNAGAGAVWRTPDLTNFTNGAGLPAAIEDITGLATNAGTILATTANGNVCRSVNNGANYTCVNPAGLAGFSLQSVTPVTAGVWLIIDGGRAIGRSIDDGVNWSVITTLAGTSAQPGIACVSASVCLAATGDRVVRSTDAGLTWTSTTLGPLTAGTPQRPVGIANFGAGIINVLNAPIAATQALAYRSDDNGGVFQITPATALLAITNTRNYLALSTSGGNGIAVVQTDAGGAAPNAQAYFTSSLGAGQVQVKGDNGATWFISADGQGLVMQGSGSAGTATSGGWRSVPQQGVSLLSTTPVTSGANAAAVLTVPGAANTRTCLRNLALLSSAAGAATFTVSSSAGPTVVWNAGTVATGLEAKHYAFPAGVCVDGATNLVVNIGAAGAAVTTTTSAIADRQ